MRLHAYQELARDFLRGPGRGLFLDMGLGKTAITLSALEPEHLPAIVIAPKRVAENVWHVERDKWRPDLEVSLAVGEPKKRARALDARGDITVISKDNIDDLIGRKPYRTVILDELSVFKGRGARWKTARKITDKADRVWGLTGTPAPNGYLDLWAQVFLLDKGQRLGRSYGQYQNHWFKPNGRLPNGTYIDWQPRKGAEEEIRRLIQDVCLYMSADDELDLPPATPNTVAIPLPGSARKMYNALNEDLVLDLEDLGLEIYSAGTAAIATNKLQQIANGFIFSDAQDGTYADLHDAKIRMLGEIIEGTGDNILVFYNFNPERERIRKAFPQARLISEPGVIAEWCRGEVPLMLAHPASAGHGLNLQTGGHTVVWASPTWDLELYLQGNGRLARQGQAHPVIIHHLVCTDTIDESIMYRLETKDFKQDVFLDHLRSPL